VSSYEAVYTTSARCQQSWTRVNFSLPNPIQLTLSYCTMHHNSTQEQMLSTFCVLVPQRQPI